MKTIPKDKLVVRQSNSLAFRGGQIWFEQLDALSIHTEFVKEKFLNDMNNIRKPSTPALIAINLNETLVDIDLVETIVSEFSYASEFIQKVVFVGLERKWKKQAKQLLKQYEHSFIYTFIDDYEKAKEWLIDD